MKRTPLYNILHAARHLGRIGRSVGDVFRNLDRSDWLFVFVIVSACSAYFFHRQHHFVPNTDFFALLNEGSWLLSHPFDWLKYPPVYGVLLAIFEHLSPMQRGAQEGGVLLNILATAITATLVWRVTKSAAGAWGLVPILWWLGNPLTFETVLQPLNFSLFLMLTVVSIVLHEKRPAWAYVVAAIAFYTRYEGFVLFIIFAASDVLRLGRVRRVRTFGACLLLVAVWLLRSALSGNQYAEEMLVRSAEIPNYQIIPMYTIAAPLLNRLDVPGNPIGLLLYAGVGMFMFISRMPQTLVKMIGFGYLYLFVHVMFPEVALRYGYPLLPPILLLYSWPVFVMRTLRKPVISVVAGAFMLTALVAVQYSYSRAPYLYEFERDLNGELRLAAEWLDSHIKHPSVAYAYQSWVYDYYSDNPRVSYAYFHTMDSFRQSMDQENLAVYVLLQNAYDVNNIYLDTKHGIGFYKTIQSAPESYGLRYIHTVRYGESSVSVYEKLPVRTNAR